MVITQGIEMSLLKNHTDNNYLINKPNQLNIKYYNLFPYILNFEDYFTFKFKTVCSVHNTYYCINSSLTIKKALYSFSKFC